MKRIVLVIAIFFATAVIAEAQVTIFSKPINIDSVAYKVIDSVYFDISNWDYFGVSVYADSAANVVLYFDASAALDKYVGSITVNSQKTTYADSLTVTGTVGNGKFITLRSASVNNIPWGANFLKIRRANKTGNSAIAAGSKLLTVVIDGVRFRQRRIGE